MGSGLLAGETPDGALPDRTRIAVEALSRLKGADIENNSSLKNAVLNILDQTRGTPYFLQIVRDFHIQGKEPDLLEQLLAQPNAPESSDAVRLIVANGRLDLLEKAVASPVPQVAGSAAELLGKTGDKKVVPILLPVVSDAKRDLQVRQAAVRSLAQTEAGALALLDLAKKEKLPNDLRLVTSTELNLSHWAAIQKESAEVLPLPRARSAEPLPPISELAKRTGDAKRGEAIFFKAETVCSTCHQINGRGADFGPSLSEIGTKLGKDAIYTAILDPSAGISFGYEGFEIELKNGDELTGIIASDTADELVVKAQAGAVTHVKKSDVAKRRQMKLSIMPAGLQQTMTTQELVDLVEYLSTLKKK